LQITDKQYPIMLYSSSWLRFELTTSVVIGTDCIGSSKSNYHTIMGMVVLIFITNISILWFEFWKIGKKTSFHNGFFFPASTSKPFLF
jgi:hypothetical protein